MKKNLILVIFFGILLVGTLIVINRRSLFHEQADNFVGSFQKNDIMKIQIKKNNESVLLQKDTDGWYTIHGEERKKADESKILTALDALLSTKKTDLISSKAEKYGQFELNDDMALQVELYRSGDDRVFMAYFGKTGAGYQSQYFRENESSDIYLIDRNVSLLLPASSQGWEEVNKEDEEKTSSESNSEAGGSRTP